MLCTLFALYGAVYRMVFIAALTEEQGNAPHTGQPNQRINHTADNGHLTAAKKSDTVKAENADAAPVQGTHDGEDQGESVKKHKLTSDSFALMQTYFACMEVILYMMSCKIGN